MSITDVKTRSYNMKISFSDHSYVQTIEHKHILKIEYVDQHRDLDSSALS